ncbi:hypothetical protein N9B82_01605 [Saprospiraceae bacterium]|nr:hypothetical protein [Saprospiraceae bacterium]
MKSIFKTLLLTLFIVGSLFISSCENSVNDPTTVSELEMKSIALLQNVDDLRSNIKEALKSHEISEEDFLLAVKTENYDKLRVALNDKNVSEARKSTVIALEEIRPLINTCENCKEGSNQDLKIDGNAEILASDLYSIETRARDCKEYACIASCIANCTIFYDGSNGDDELQFLACAIACYAVCCTFTSESF